MAVDMCIDSIKSFEQLSDQRWKSPCERHAQSLQSVLAYEIGRRRLGTMKTEQKPSCVTYQSGWGTWTRCQYSPAPTPSSVQYTPGRASLQAVCSSLNPAKDIQICVESLILLGGKRPGLVILIGRFHLWARLRGAELSNRSIEKVDLIVEIDDCMSGVRNYSVDPPAHSRALTYC